MNKILNPILNLFRYQKKKMASALGFYLFFLYLYFPFNDLGDLVGTKIAEVTGNQIFVTFDTLNVSLFPVGLAMSNVLVETPMTPPLTAEKLNAGLSLSGLLSLKPGVSLYAQKLMGGNVGISTRGGEKSTGGETKQKISASLDRMSLRDISTAAQAPLKVEGQLSGDISTSIDLSFTDQPQGDISLKLDKVEIPEGNVTTMLGPLALPKMILNEIVLEGKMDKGTIDIQKFNIGKPGSDILATVSGRMDMKFEKAGQLIEPRFGGYDLTVRLQVSENTKQKLGAFLSFIQAYQNANNSYAFKVASSNFYAPPNIVKIQ